MWPMNPDVHDTSLSTFYMPGTWYTSCQLIFMTAL